MNSQLFCKVATAFGRRQSLIQISHHRNYIKPALAYKPIQSSIVLFKHCAQRKVGYLTHVNIDPSKLTKDVIVFKYDNPRYFKIMNIFGVVQFVVWTALAEFNINTLRDIPVDETVENFNEQPFYKRINLGTDTYRYGISCLFVGLGILSLCFIWMYTLRTVRYLILRKGGKNIAIVTYGPLGNNRIMTVPLDCIKTTGTTQSGISTIPLKVKNILFHYLLDTKGEFTNKALFDHVINLKRRW